jgi:hypothetical protein
MRAGKQASDLLQPTLVREFNLYGWIYLTNNYDLWPHVPSCMQEVAHAKEKAILDKIVCLLKRVGSYFQTDNALTWTSVCECFIFTFYNQSAEDILEDW